VEKPESIAERIRFAGHGSEVTRLVLSADGTTLASADAENRLIGWNLEGPKILLNHRWPGAVTSLAFAPDSRYLAVGMSNGVTYILRVHPTPQ
jgi:WD40 repeat protein